MTWESPASCFSKIMFGQQNLDSGFMSWQGGMGQTCRSEASVHCVIYIDSQSMELYEFLSRVCSLRIDWPKFLFSFCYDMYISHTLGQSLDKSPMLVYIQPQLSFCHHHGRLMCALVDVTTLPFSFFHMLPNLSARDFQLSEPVMPSFFNCIA